MKTAIAMVFIFSLVACQKEIQFPVQNAKIQVRPDPPKSAVNLDEFITMLNENFQYQITRHFSETEDLWYAVPSWVKDDAYTFRDSGEGWIDANTEKDPDHPFFGKDQGWKVFTENNQVFFEWVDYNYESMVFIVESFELNKSFILSYKRNEQKVYSEYQIWQ